MSKNTIIRIPWEGRSYDELCEVVRALKGRRDLLFELGDGELGWVRQVVDFQYSNGVEKVQFQPIENSVYLLKKDEYGCNYIVEVENWLDVMVQY